MVHATSEDDLSPNGQQSSVPTGKTMGEIAYGSFNTFNGNAVCWPLANGHAKNEMQAWEAAAEAVIREAAGVMCRHCGLHEELIVEPRSTYANFYHLYSWGGKTQCDASDLHNLWFVSQAQREGDRSALPSAGK